MNMKNNICFVAHKKKKTEKEHLFQYIVVEKEAEEKIGEKKLNIYLEILAMRI